MEGHLKEKDLENRLAPDGGKVSQIPAPALQGADAELTKDYQLQRALELLRSLQMIKEQGFSFR